MKQETTLEEAAESFAKTQVVRGQNLSEWDDKVEEIIARIFTEGAKWQQEQDKNNEKELYSEIEYLIINWSNDGTKTAGALTRQIIEQFKKK
jgi:hypothetical protein